MKLLKNGNLISNGGEKPNTICYFQHLVLTVRCLTANSSNSLQYVLSFWHESWTSTVKSKLKSFKGFSFASIEVCWRCRQQLFLAGQIPNANDWWQWTLTKWYYHLRRSRGTNGAREDHGTTQKRQQSQSRLPHRRRGRRQTGQQNRHGGCNMRKVQSTGSCCTLWLVEVSLKRPSAYNLVTI